MFKIKISNDYIEAYQTFYDPRYLERDDILRLEGNVEVIASLIDVVIFNKEFEEIFQRCKRKIVNYNDILFKTDADFKRFQNREYLVDSTADVNDLPFENIRVYDNIDFFTLYENNLSLKLNPEDPIIRCPLITISNEYYQDHKEIFDDYDFSEASKDDDTWMETPDPDLATILKLSL